MQCVTGIRFTLGLGGLAVCSFFPLFGSHEITDGENPGNFEALCKYEIEQLSLLFWVGVWPMALAALCIPS